MTRARTRPLVIAVLVLVVLLAVAHPLGYRLNPRTARVGVPAATAAPEQVALAYLDAFNHRDRATMKAIFPSRSVPRFRAMGRLHDVTVVNSHPMSASERTGGVGEGHVDAATVQGALTYTGFDPWPTPRVRTGGTTTWSATGRPTAG